MSLPTLNCPRCGAPLDLAEKILATMECPYCKNTVIIPPELRSAAPGPQSGSGLAPGNIAEIHRLLQAGQKIEAVKHVRQLTNLGLKEAKDIVDALERGESIDMELQFLQPAQSKPVLDVHKLAELGQLVRSGQKIEAIKLVRELTNLGLKESKEMVEAMERGEPVQIVSQQISTSAFSGSPIEVDASFNNLPPDLERQLRSLLEINNRAGAVRLLRQRLDLSQVVAEQTVDNLAGGANLPQALTQAYWKAGVIRQTSQVSAQSTKALNTAVKATTGAVGCSALFTILLTLGILLFAGGIVAVAMMSSGGPLEEFGASINPLASARLDLSFGGEGSGQGLFLDPRQLAVAPDGTVYVSDFDTGRIQHFSADGQFINLWIIPGTETQDEVYINDLEVDLNGLVYVAVNGELRVYDGVNPAPLQILDPEYQLPDDSWASDLYIDDLEFGPDGTRYIIDGDTLARLDANGEIELVIEEMIEKITKDSETVTYLAIDGLNNLYIAGGNNYAVFKYNRDGVYQTRFGSQGEQPGQFNAVLGATADPYGRVYVSSSYGIDIFESSGRFIERLDVIGVAFDFKIDPQNRLWIVNNQDRVVRYQLAQPSQ